MASRVTSSGNLELVGHRDDGERVEHVVRARHLHGEARPAARPTVGVEVRREALVAGVSRAVVGLPRDAVGHVAALDARQDLLHVRVVEAERRRGRRTAPCWRTGRTRPSRARACRSESRCSASMLVTTAMVGVSLRNEPSLSSASATKRSPSPEPRVGAERVDLSADDHRGIEAGRAQHRGHERGRRRLAVRAGDGDAVAHAHQLREHLGPRDDGDLEGAGASDLRVLRVDGARVDDDVGALDVRRRGARAGCARPGPRAGACSRSASGRSRRRRTPACEGSRRGRSCRCRRCRRSARGARGRGTSADLRGRTTACGMRRSWRRVDEA